MKPSDNEIEMLAAGFAIQHKNGLIRFAHALLDKYAPQASAEDAVTPPADVAQLVAFIFDRFGQPGDAGALPDNVAAAVRRLERGIKAQAGKDGGQQRAGDECKHARAYHAMDRNSYICPDCGTVVHEYEIYRLQRAALSANQTEQGERYA